ncbi:MAG: hydrocarbon degradation protein, partial [Planctomycetes bacterium]|nr:hydrocarbon degradation protein [Planctomycetota bacterium]
MNTRHILTAALLVALFSAPAVAQTGHALNGVGAVNQSMAGAGTALPLDPSGAIHWNPASISGLETSEIQFSMEMMRPSLTLASSIYDTTNTVEMMSGSTDGTEGIFAIPSFGMVYKTDGPWTFGMGAYGISGFGVNYPGDAMNPI